MSISLSGIKYKRLKQTHPRVDLMRLRILRALYRGGVHLLKDDEVMKRVFPKYTYEGEPMYAERRNRAYYENLFALVINQMAAGLAQDPAKMVPKKSTDTTATPVVDEYWLDLASNATAFDEDGSTQRTLDQVLRDLCVEGLVCGWSWLQIELPKSDGEAQSRADQDATGELDAYFCTWPTDQITDWEEKDGRILWLRTYECSQTAETPDAMRDIKRHTWTVWTDTEWVSYVVEESKNPQDNRRLPADDDMISPRERGEHPFGRVPWICFDVCTPGTYLHIGDFIESSCRSYFNRTNGETFQWTQYNFQQLYEFLAPEVPGLDNDVSEAQKDPNRARGKRAPGEVHVRGHEDHVEWSGPDMGGAAAGRAAIQDQRDSILRMATQMALSQDTSGAMLRRSGESKAQDAVAQEIMLGAIGKRLLTTGRQAVTTVATIRQETETMPTLEGYQRFSVADAEQLINQAVNLEKVTVPSARYQIERKIGRAHV